MTPAGVENLVYAAVLFALIGLGLFAFVRWAIKDTSHLTPEEAVNHREKVIRVDKGLAVTNVALSVLNQGIKHAGPGPAKKTTALPMKWYSAEKGAVGPSDGAADLPRVGRLGSSCAGEVYLTMGRSSDGYQVMCVGGTQYDKPGTTPVWDKYSP